MEKNIVIVSAARTPMGGFQGCFKEVCAVELGALAVREALSRSGLQPVEVQEVIMGCVLGAGLKQGPAAGLPSIQEFQSVREPPRSTSYVGPA